MSIEIPTPSELEAWWEWIKLHWSYGADEKSGIIIGFLVLLLLASAMLKVAITTLGLQHVPRLLWAWSRRIQIKRRTIIVKRSKRTVITRFIFFVFSAVFISYVFFGVVVPYGSLNIADWTIGLTGQLTLYLMVWLTYLDVRSGGERKSTLYWPAVSSPLHLPLSEGSIARGELAIEVLEHRFHDRFELGYTSFAGTPNDNLLGVELELTPTLPMSVAWIALRIDSNQVRAEGVLRRTNQEIHVVTFEEMINVATGLEVVFEVKPTMAQGNQRCVIVVRAAGKSWESLSFDVEFPAYPNHRF